MVRRQAWRRPSESSGEPWMPQLLWRPIKNGASLPQWGQIKQLGPFEAHLENRKLSIIQDKSSQVLKVLPSLVIVWPQDSVAITCCWFFQSHICHIYTRHIGTVLEPKKGEWLKVATWPSHVSVELRDRTMSNSSSLSKAGKALRRHMESKGGRKKGCWNSTTRTESPKAIGFGFLFSPASPCIVKKRLYSNWESLEMLEGNVPRKAAFRMIFWWSTTNAVVPESGTHTVPDVVIRRVQRHLDGKGENVCFLSYMTTCVQIVEIHMLKRDKNIYEFKHLKGIVKLRFWELGKSARQKEEFYKVGFLLIFGEGRATFFKRATSFFW